MRKKRLNKIMGLQLIVIIYTIAGIMAKLASQQETITSMGIFLALELFLMGVYAFFWQQMIKIFPLSIAYANRAMGLLWSALWAKIIFQESVGLKQWIAIILVMAGILLVNGEEEEDE